MKIAYLAPYRDKGGYATAAKSYILALDKVGAEVVPRPIKMTPGDGYVPDRIDHLEKGDLKNVDVLIQHNLPSEFSYQGGVQNVGMFAYETDGFPWTNWDQNLMMMDKIVNFCEADRQATISSCRYQKDIQNKVFVCPHALDVERYDQEIENLDIDDSYKFYTITEYNRRKNLPSLIVAYLSEFDCYDNVSLVIKTGGSKQEIKSVIEEIKNGLNRFNNQRLYPQIILIDGDLTPEQMDRIHSTCDCYVNTSFGESFCIPFFDACGFGNQLIAPDSRAFKDYSPTGLCRLLATSPTSVFGYKNAPNRLYTSDEKWDSVSVPDVKNAMRHCRENYSSRNERCKKHRSDLIKKNFNSRKVGEQLVQIIEKNYAK